MEKCGDVFVTHPVGMEYLHPCRGTIFCVLSRQRNDKNKTRYNEVKISKNRGNGFFYYSGKFSWNAWYFCYYDVRF